MSWVDSTYIEQTGDEKLRGMSYTIQYKILVGKSGGGGGAGVLICMLNKGGGL